MQLFTNYSNIHNFTFKQSFSGLMILKRYRGQKFHLSARNYEGNLDRTSNSSQSTCLTGRVLWEELREEVLLHITPLCSLLHIRF